MKKITSFIFFLVLSFSLLFFSCNQRNNISAENRSQINEDIRLLKENGLILKINPQLNEVFVDAGVWRLLDYQTKERTGRSMAFYCGFEKGTNLNWVDIKDSETGKKLAKYSESWGFEVN